MAGFRDPGVRSSVPVQEDWGTLFASVLSVLRRKRFMYLKENKGLVAGRILPVSHFSQTSFISALQAAC
jgi:hypothetical protein